MLSKVYSAGLYGIDGFIVSVEVNGEARLPEFELVGLPDAAVKEAKERVRTACENSGFRFPETALLVNLAPADRRKEGSGFDAAILTGILAVGGLIRPDADLSDKCFVGELSLSGEFRSVHGMLSMCVAARDAGMKEFYAPMENAAEAAAVEGIDVYGIKNMRQLVDHLNRLRCYTAKHYLMHSDKKISEIATLCGYKDGSYFARTYKKFVGHAPNETPRKSLSIQN